MNDRLRLGYYAYYPTILEPAPGPWGGREIFELHPVDAWERILGWLSGRGVDYVVAVISPKYRDNIFHDWPFHYVCDLDEYPEARMFPAELVRRHREITDRVVDIAADVGVDMYFTHCNFCSPRGVLETRPRLLEKYRATRGQGAASHDAGNVLNTILGNICWRDPEYQRFLKACWTEFFEAIPRAKGLMITPGEFNLCRCPDCRGPSLDPDDVAASRAAMKLDFVNTFVAEMDRAGKESLVRTWYLDADPADLPRATAVLTKYQAFDCFDGPIDPQAEKELASGRPVHLMFAQNGENAAQVLWFRPGYWRRIGRDMNERGIQGAVIMHNTDWGMSGMTNPVSALNLEAFFHYARHPGDDGTDVWRRRVGEMLGSSVADDVLHALDLLSEFPMNVTRIIFLGTEGYTYGPIQPCDADFAPDPWGVLGRNWTPPDWARGDVGRLRDYWDFLGGAPFVSFDELATSALPDGEKCPLRIMDNVVAAAESAVVLLTGLADRIAPAGRGFWDGLVCSAHLTHEHALMLLNSMKTALLLRAARAPANAGRSVELGRRALETHTAALDALKHHIGWMNALPHDALDFAKWLRLRMPDYNTYQAVMFTPLELMERENENLRNWVAQMDPAAEVPRLARTAIPSLTARDLPPMPKRGWTKT